MFRKKIRICVVAIWIACVSVFINACMQKKQEEVLTICVDKRNASEIEMLLRFWEQEDPRHAQNVELVVIPEGGVQAQAAIKKIQTQLMAGKGPDLFLLQTLNPAERQGNVLFDNPEKIMRNHMFFPLNELLQEAQYIDLQKWNPLVLQAGESDKQQYILPLYYDYFSYVIPDEISEKTAEHLINSRLDLRFSNICGDWIDYGHEEVIVSPKQLQQVCENVYQAVQGSSEYREDWTRITGSSFSGIAWSAMTDPRPHRIKAQRNYSDGVSAHITFYAAINRNARQAEMAFRFLDWMFSAPAEQRRTLSIPYGCPISDSEWETVYASLSEEDRNAIHQIQSEMNEVSFYSEADLVLNELYEAYRAAREAQEDGSSVIENAWNQLQWIAAE